VFLYYYANELYKMNRMMERAELIKFLYIFSLKLKNNTYKPIFETSLIQIHPTKKKKIEKSTSINSEREIYNNHYNNHQNNNNNNHNNYNNQTNHVPSNFYNEQYKNKKKYFKTKLLNKNDYIVCDICGQRLKIGMLSVYAYNFNIVGHYEHVISFINTNKTNNR
jgi:hypothetical protein